MGGCVLRYAVAMVEQGRLQQIPLFKDLGAHRLKQVAEVAQLEQHRKRDVLFRQGEPAKKLWVLLEGWVHLIRTPKAAAPTFDGTRGVVIFTVTPAEVLVGISSLESTVYTMSGVAGTDCTAIRVPGSLFGDLVRHEPHFGYDVLRLFTRRFHKVAEQYGAMAEPVMPRVVRALLRLREQFGVTIPMTHRELAQMSWTTTESAIRAVRKLKDAGLVTGSRGEFIVQRPAALERLVSSAHGGGRPGGHDG